MLCLEIVKATILFGQILWALKRVETQPSKDWIYEAAEGFRGHGFCLNWW